MLRMLQVAEAGMRVQQARVDVLTNNLANADTPGFRRVLASFDVRPDGPDQPARPRPGDPPLPQMGEGRGTVGMVGARTGLDLRPGAVRHTGNPLDVALAGEGFFAVRTAEGERYTRNGSFSLSPEGRLQTLGGEVVLGDGGPLEIPPGQLEVGADGSLRVDGEEVGKLKVVRVEGELRPGAGQLLELAPGAQARPLPDEERRVMGQHLEGSNANPVRELVALIQAHRLFEAGQRVLSTTDDSLGRTVNDLGRVR